MRIGGLSLHLPDRRGAGPAQKRPLWRYSDLGEGGGSGRHKRREGEGERERRGSDLQAHSSKGYRSILSLTVDVDTKVVRDQ